MDRFPKLPFGIAAAAVFLCASLAAQPAHRWSSIFQHWKRPRTTVPTGQSPFPLGQEAPPHATLLQFRSPDQMTPADRELEVKSQSAIAAHAAFANFQLNDGAWNVQQIVCRALPNHLFLRFTRNNGAGDRSVFSVSIPRNRQGRLRVIPVLRRGYSLFSPAPSNNGTIAAFNQIRREDGPNPTSGWLQTALCYAALAGADPNVGHLTGNAVVNDPSPPLAEMLVTIDGGAVVTFTDEAAKPRPDLWTMTFSPTGALLKVKREPALLNSRVIMPQQTQQSQTTILPGSTGQFAKSSESETKAPAPPAPPVLH